MIAEKNMQRDGQANMTIDNATFICMYANVQKYTYVTAAVVPGWLCVRETELLPDLDHIRRDDSTLSLFIPFFFFFGLRSV